MKKQQTTQRRTVSDTARSRPSATPDPKSDVMPPVLRVLGRILTDRLLRETIRHRLIDGLAGPLELVLWKIALPGYLEDQAALRRIRFLPPELFEKWRDGEVPEETEEEAARRARTEEEPGPGRIKFTKLKRLIRRWAKELIEDPEYQPALWRRLQDGQAREILSYALAWAFTASEDPAWQQVGRPRLTVICSLDPKNDPLKEQQDQKLEAQRAQEEQRAQERQQRAHPEPPAQGLKAPVVEEPGEPDDYEVVQVPPNLIPLKYIREPY